MTLNLVGFTLAFGYGTKLGHPISTIYFFGGLILFITSIIGFIQVVRNSSIEHETDANLNFLFSIVGFYALGSLMLVYFLSEGWNEFESSQEKQTIVAVFLAIAIATVIYSNYGLGKESGSRYAIASSVVSILGFFSCVFF